MEIAIVLVIVLIIFGPKRLPELAKSVGKASREFKSAIRDDGEPAKDSSATEISSGEESGPSVTATPVNDKQQTGSGSGD
jgi:sec-independent protein translocase protein TatA